MALWPTPEMEHEARHQGHARARGVTMKKRWAVDTMKEGT